MKKIIGILCVVFIVSCTYEDSGFRRLSKQEAMQSWAWKIFIFTGEGEYQPIDSEVNKFYIYNNIQDKPIFANDIWKTDLQDELFLNTHEIAFETAADNTNFSITKRKK
ncbi:hypothetical protein [Flavobacterium aestuarii]|uniref:hypothetical protein n=1 Tax=Flavobacterium aestuarii TaxID=3149227 RepID=UPI0032B4C421